MTAIPILLAVMAGGLLLLYISAEGLVRGAAGLALRLGVRPMVVGLTVVAFGTSAPELLASIITAYDKMPAIAIGNVVGSNVANIGLIAGLMAALMPFVADRSFLKIDLPILFAAMGLLWLLSLDGLISRPDGLILLFGFAAFLIVIVTTARRRGPSEDDGVPVMMPWWKTLVYTGAGLAGLVIGARAFVWSSVGVAMIFGVSERVIGMTVVAVGTSLPELAASLVAVIRKNADIGLGNIIGSNIFNVLGILGVAPLVRPLEVEQGFVVMDYPVMVGFSLALFLLMLKKSRRIGRIEGLIMLAAYALFMVWIMRAG